MRTLILLLAAAAALPGQIGSKSIAPVSVGRKVALVIGNSAYSRLESIPAAANDADDMSATLQRLGFSVTVRKNLGVEALITEVASFSSTVRPGDLAVLYYSGHGGSVGEENYLLPVDYDPPAQKDLVERRAYAMSKVRDAMEQSGARVRVLIFDACRGTALTAKGSDDGPRTIEGRPEGTLIAFASAHKQDALFDARERNSLYTGRLLAALKSPDSDLKGLLESVQSRVYQDTQHQQTPYLYGFLSGPLYLAGIPTVNTVVPPVAINAELDAWNAARGSGDSVLLQSYLRRFPMGTFADQASVELRNAFNAEIRMLSPEEVKSRQAESSRLFQQAYTELMAKRVPQAIALYERAATAWHSGQTHTFLGWAYSYQNNVQRATAECRIAIAIDPDYGNPYNDIGNYLIRQGHPDQAISWLERATQAKNYDNREYPWANLGTAYVTLKDYAKARECFLKALRIRPDYAFARSELAKLPR